MRFSVKTAADSWLRGSLRKTALAALALPMVTGASFVAASLMAPQMATAQTASGEAPAQTAPNWATACSSKDRLTQLSCAMEQRVVLRQTGQALSNIVIQFPPAGEPVVSVRVPLGLSLPDGMTLLIDDAEQAKLPITTCEANGCFVRTPLTEALLGAMRKGSNLVMLVKNNRNAEVRIPFTLAGFSAAYDAVK